MTKLIVTLFALLVMTAARAEDDGPVSVSGFEREDYSGRTVDPYENLRGYRPPQTTTAPQQGRYLGRSSDGASVTEVVPGHLIYSYSNGYIDVFSVPGEPELQVVHTQGRVQFKVNGAVAETIVSSQNNGQYDLVYFNYQVPSLESLHLWNAQNYNKFMDAQRNNRGTLAIQRAYNDYVRSSQVYAITRRMLGQ